MGKYLFLLFVLIFASASAQDQWKDVYKESAWAERDAWQKPDDIIKILKLKPGDQVADIGCHEGYMSVKLSKTIGTTGKVYAVDVNQSRLDQLAQHLADRKISNVSVIKGDYDNPKLSANSIHAALIIDTYHEMDDHDKILQHIKTALRPGGRLVICEPIADSRKDLARSEQERKHEIGMKYVLEDLTKAGFKIISKQDLFIDREKIKGDKMWIVVAIK
ncbi:MAG: methyltransferase domain-containing protein [Flammeovirgaceae bacterium]|nr:methyltransferase domain-containing protein [Flammeovirgaceae bacterium]